MGETIFFSVRKRQSPIEKCNLKKSKTKTDDTCAEWGEESSRGRGSATTHPNLRPLCRVLPLSANGGYRVVYCRNDILRVYIYTSRIRPYVT